jgi:hypothetical protein
VAREEDSVGDDIMGANLAVVPYMTASHKEVFVADDGVFFEFGGTMNRGVFAKDVSGANDKSGWGSGVFEILWRISDHRAGMETIVGANGGVSGQVHVRLYNAVGAQMNIGVNYSKGTYQDTAPDFCIGMHAGERMDLCGDFGVHGWK